MGKAVKEAVLYPLRRAAMWAVMDGPKLPDGWAPWLFGFAIGAKPVPVEEGDDG